MNMMEMPVPAKKPEVTPEFPANNSDVLFDAKGSPRKWRMLDNGNAVLLSDEEYSDEIVASAENDPGRNGKHGGEEAKRITHVPHIKPLNQQ